VWELVEDGTVKVQLIGRVATLRRPKLGEFKMLRQTLEAAQNSAAKQANTLSLHAMKLNNLTAEERLDDAIIPELEWVREQTTEVRDIGEDIRTMWFTLVLGTLDADGRAPHEDEYPPEILEGPWQNELITHWLSGNSTARPTPPGDA